MKALLAVLLAVLTSACVLVAEPGPGGAKSAGADVVLCHKGTKTLTLPREAASAHIEHGDRYGAC